VVEKTVRRAERAWFISAKEMGARPGSDRSFLAGETERNFVFEPLIGTPSMSFITLSYVKGSMGHLIFWNNSANMDCVEKSSDIFMNNPGLLIIL